MSSDDAKVVAKKIREDLDKFKSSMSGWPNIAAMNDLIEKLEAILERFPGQGIQTWHIIIIVIASVAVLGGACAFHYFRKIIHQ